MQIIIKYTVRLRCEQCGNYKTICLNEICPLFADRKESGKCLRCGNTLSKAFHEVPWWHGRKIPTSVEFWWSEKSLKSGKPETEIPKSFLDVNIWLAGENGIQVNWEDAIQYFLEKARKKFPNANVKIISDEEWAENHSIPCSN